MKRFRHLLIGSLLAILLAAACTPITRPEQAAVFDLLPLDAEQSLGQTFVARFDGMNGVEIYLEPLEPGKGEIQLTLREAVQGEKLGRTAVPVAEVTAPGFYRFPLPVQADSNHEDYFLTLKIRGAGRVNVGAAPGNTYLNGALYRSGIPDDAHQMAFQLSYHPPRLALGLASEFLTWGWYLLAAAFLFVLPGWAVLTWMEGRGTKSEERGGWSEEGGASAESTPHARRANNNSVYLAIRIRAVKLALAAGISLAGYPILFLWTHLAGLHLGWGYAVLPGAIGLGWMVWRWQAAIRRQPSTVRGWCLHPSCLASAIIRIHPADWTLLILLGLIVFSRFWVIRTLEGPMWGDGMQHTMIVQLLLDHGGLFNSWQPYAPMETFTYHFGFHTAGAVFAHLTGLEARFATLWTGQILNILAVLAVYPLAWKISGGNRWAGTGAVLVAGLLSPMPAFYVNWGRYTQLAGQVILPAALFLTWDWLDRKAPLNRRMLLLGGMLWGGLGLTHYRVLIMGILGLLAYLLIHLRRSNWRRILGGSLTLGLVGGLIALPWYIHAFSGRLVTMFSNQLHVQPVTNSSAAQAAAVTGNLADYLHPWVWVLIPIGLGLMLWQHRRWSRVFGLWWVLLAIAAYPDWLRLPGGAIIGYFTMWIAAYLLAGVAVGNLFPRAGNTPRWTPILLGGAILAAGIWGLGTRRGEVNPLRFAMVTRPDVRAAAWVRKNTSSEAVFLIENFAAYNGHAAVGADGGWWLPILTERGVSHPPLLYGFEADPYPGFRQDLLDLTNTLREYGADAPETLALLRERGITHVYIGQQQGSVNSQQPALPPGALLGSPHYQPVYHQDRVWVFEVVW